MGPDPAIRAGVVDTPRPPRVVARPALFGVLSAGGPGGVTLVSAPAGSGKTVLLRSWLDHAGLGDRAAWVAVARGEQDAQRFWLAVVRGLRAAVGAEPFVEQLAPTPEFDGEAVVARLVSELGRLEQPLVLVVDDLHELRSSEALAQLELLLERRPPLLRVVLATRRDPQLGLHRLRLAGELTELRAADLRFTREEARALLAAAGVALPDESLALLHERTEGWAAGLRLAALSLGGHPAPQRFVAEFSGTERTVAEYLLAEVLARQPADVRRLLLCTSVLDQVNGALADHLVGAGSERILQSLEEANAFVVALDAGRTRFRYHHLFADLLRLELRRTDPDAVPELHRAAAGWYAQHGEVVEAVRHAQAAEDWHQAARLVADHYFSLLLNGQAATATALLAAFPADAVADPELAVALAADRMAFGSLDEANTYLALAERGASTVPDDRRHRFEMGFGAMRLSVARRRGDFASVLDQVQPLLALAEPRRPDELGLGNDLRAIVLMHLGVVELWAPGGPDDAERHLEQARGLARRTDRPWIEVSSLGYAALGAARRSFALARRRAAEAIGTAEAHGLGSHPVVGPALAVLAGLAAWQGRLEEAEDWLERAGGVAHPEGELTVALLLELARGTLRLGQGRPDAALTAFRDAERLHARLVTPHPLALQVRQLLVQTLVRLGRSAEAREALAEAPAAERDRGESRVALGWLRLGEAEPAAVVDALAPVLDGSTRVLGDVTLVQARLLDAVARDRLGDGRAAQDDVERALELAEPNALVWPFLVAPVRELLEHHPRHGTAHAALLADVLDALAGSSPRVRDGEPAAAPEELSEGELRVLRYLPTNLGAPEIGAELYLSLNTVKTHLRHIYAKLGVHRRTEAVERARQLGLLGPSARHR